MQFSIAAITASLVALVAAAPALKARVPPQAPFAIQVHGKSIIDHKWNNRFVTLIHDNSKGINYASVDIPNAGQSSAEFSMNHNNYLVWNRYELFAGFENNSEHDYRSPLVFGAYNVPGMTIETGLSWTSDGKLQLNGKKDWYICDHGDDGGLNINFGKSWTKINPHCHAVDLYRVYQN